MNPTWNSAGYLGGIELNRLLTANSNPVSSVKKAICFCRWYVHFSPKYVSKNSRAASTSDTRRSTCLSLIVRPFFRCPFEGEGCRRQLLPCDSSRGDPRGARSEVGGGRKTTAFVPN